MQTITRNTLANLFTTGRTRRRLLRLSTFQIGSAMGEIVIASIWNRIMINEFGIPAWPISLLIAMRYFLAPLSLWAGHRADTMRHFRYRRTVFIWSGRALMLTSLLILGASLTRFDGGQRDFSAWALATLSLFLYGIGTLISGSNYLALVRDTAPPNKGGLAISLAETVLIIFFAVAGTAFSIRMRDYSLELFQQLIWFTVLIGGFFWFFAIIGIEKSRADAPMDETTAEKSALLPALKQVWQDRRTRMFFYFLSLATMAAWAQDVILEPFGGDALHLSAGVTTRFNVYWQIGTIITLVTGVIIWRKRAPQQQVVIARWGLSVMAVGMVMLALSSLFAAPAPATGFVTGFGQFAPNLAKTALMIFGLGFGVYTFGGLSLMAVMSPARHAGIYLSLWSISIFLFKGLGTLAGGVLRDVLLLGMGVSAETGYAVIFFLEAIGLAGAALILSREAVLSFHAENKDSAEATPAPIITDL